MKRGYVMLSEAPASARSTLSWNSWESRRLPERFLDFAALRSE